MLWVQRTSPIVLKAGLNIVVNTVNCIKGWAPTPSLLQVLTKESEQTCYTEIR